MSLLESKDPNAIVDYVINWAEHLDVDTISSSAWTVPSGITKSSDTFASQSATIWLSGGSAGVVYALLNRIVTAGGRTLDQTIRVRVRER